MRILMWLMMVLFVAPIVARAETSAEYDAETRTLVVHVDGAARYRFVFNKGGAINGVYDLKIDPEANMVGESYQGETTDRVIQWTYWNERYRGSPHGDGSKDTRANVTMEGCYDDDYTCDVLETPRSGRARELVFRSRVTHWFFAVLDRHGRPNFETTSRYEVLDDGSLKLTRSVLRRAWGLRDVVETRRNGGREVKVEHARVRMVADYDGRRMATSYFEGWTPLRRTVLPRTRHGRGGFEASGYRQWRPQDLGGWAMAYGETLAFAVVFGTTEFGDKKHDTRAMFNRQDLANHRLNILMPAVSTDWPDDATLTQTLVFVVGEPGEVATRAEALVASVPRPVVREAGAVE